MELELRSELDQMQAPQPEISELSNVNSITEIM